MTSNPFAKLKALFAGPPLLVGTVTSVTGTDITVELPSGARVAARGSATVGQAVFVQGGVIQGEAPSLSVVNIEV